MKRTCPFVTVSPTFTASPETVPLTLGLTVALLPRIMLPVPDTEDVRVIFCAASVVYLIAALAVL